nr:unnamed protein product [Spirometra erinaceieuropaei]
MLKIFQDWDDDDDNNGNDDDIIADDDDDDDDEVEEEEEEEEEEWENLPSFPQDSWQVDKSSHSPSSSVQATQVWESSSHLKPPVSGSGPGNVGVVANEGDDEV